MKGELIVRIIVFLKIKLKKIDNLILTIKYNILFLILCRMVTRMRFHNLHGGDCEYYGVYTKLLRRVPSPTFKNPPSKLPRLFRGKKKLKKFLYILYFITFIIKYYNKIEVYYINMFSV